MPDQKTTIDINANTDLSQYKAAFDNLRDSVNGLNTEVLKFNNQSRDTVNWGSNRDFYYSSST